MAHQTSVSGQETGRIILYYLDAFTTEYQFHPALTTTLCTPWRIKITSRTIRPYNSLYGSD